MLLLRIVVVLFSALRFWILFGALHFDLVRAPRGLSDGAWQLRTANAQGAVIKDTLRFGALRFELVRATGAGRCH